jgi:hypothetical protein
LVFSSGRHFKMIADRRPANGLALRSTNNNSPMHIKKVPPTPS